MSGKLDEILRGNLAMDWYPIQGEIVILLTTSYYGHRDKLPLDGPLAFEYRLYLWSTIFQKIACWGERELPGWENWLK